jgi:hypothetical protein
MELRSLNLWLYGFICLMVLATSGAKREYYCQQGRRDERRFSNQDSC